MAPTNTRTVAAPNSHPAHAAAPTPSSTPAPLLSRLNSFLHYGDLKRRATPDSASSSISNLLTSLNATNVTIPGPLSTVPAPAGIMTGIFTANDGIYSVVSESGYVVIDGYKTLSVGQNALIGGENVAEGSSGLMVAGQAVVMSSAPVSSSIVVAVTTTNSPAAASNGGTSTTASSTAGSAGSAATGSGSSGAATSTTSGGGATTRPTVGPVLAAAGGILGLMIL